MNLLQVVSAVTEPVDDLSFIDLVTSGGFMMIPIVLLWLLAIYLFVERILKINEANQNPGDLMDQVKEFVLKGDIKGAGMLCAENNTPVARMIEKGISRIGRPLKNIEAAIENVGKIEVFKLEKNLGYLATIAGSAPMLGFLGTVIGMIEAFMSISEEEGSVSPKILSSGIYSAMITTVGGLIVGITAYIAYNYLVSRVQKVIHKMEYTSIDFMELLQEPQ